MTESLVRAPSVEPSVRLRRSALALRFGWGAIGVGAVLFLVALLLLALSLFLVAGLLVSLGVLVCGFGGFVLYRERSVRVCASCGEHFGRAVLSLAYPMDEQRYVLAIVDSGVYHRLRGLEPTPEGSPRWLNLHAVYCARCFRVGEVTVRMFSPDGSRELRGATLVGGETVQELLERGGVVVGAARAEPLAEPPAQPPAQPLARGDTEPIALALPVAHESVPHESVPHESVPPAPWSLPLPAPADEAEDVPFDEATPDEATPDEAIPDQAIPDDEAADLATILGFTDEDIPSER